MSLCRIQLGSRPGACVSLLLLNQRQDRLDGRVRPARHAGEDAAGLVDDDDAALSAARRLAEAEGRDERAALVADERVLEVVLRLEAEIGLWRVGREAVDGETVRAERLVRVPEEAGLFGACGWFISRSRC